jgi:sugar phosphate isomerase/epimerase
MKLVVFSKMLREKSISELIELAHEHGFQGYDLCVRPGYPINPENAHKELVAAVKAMQQEGLIIPMVTGNFDLLTPDHPTAEPIVAAMDQADVRLIKLGYFRFNPLQQDYWQLVGQIRRSFEGWQELGRRHNVKICYHTHSGGFMGLNCSSLMHLLEGFDPQYVGAYIDPGHMVVDGEDFAIGVAMVGEYLSIVSVKDVLLLRVEKDGHGAEKRDWVPAGEGMVDWTGVFSELKRVGFDGPVSIHSEFKVPEDRFMAVFADEVSFFMRQRQKVLNP